MCCMKSMIADRILKLFLAQKILALHIHVFLRKNLIRFASKLSKFLAFSTNMNHTQIIPGGGQKIQKVRNQPPPSGHKTISNL